MTRRVKGWCVVMHALYGSPAEELRIMRWKWMVLGLVVEMFSPTVSVQRAWLREVTSCVFSVGWHLHTRGYILPDERCWDPLGRSTPACYKTGQRSQIHLPFHRVEVEGRRKRNARLQWDELSLLMHNIAWQPCGQKSWGFCTRNPGRQALSVTWLDHVS